MNRTHSHLVDMFSIGKSYEGRQLYVLQVEGKLKDTFTKNDTQRQKYTFQTDRPCLSCVLSDRKEKPSSEEGRVDRLRGPCSGVDRTGLLSVVCQRGNIKLSFLSLRSYPLFASAFLREHSRMFGLWGPQGKH